MSDLKIYLNITELLFQEVFKEEYDKVKIKEYINMMKEQEETGRIVDATGSHSDHQFFQNG